MLWYGNGINQIEKKSDIIFNSKYHIVIENDSRNNLVSEKLYDSFLGLSFPIYYGATNINDATNANTSMDTSLGEITTSLGAVAGGLTSLQSYRNVASTTAAHLIAAASNLQDTDFAEETAKITKQSLIKNYALAMVATANADEIEKLKLLA